MCKGVRIDMNNLFPEFQKSLENLIEDEEGTIPGKKLLTLGTMVIIVDSIIALTSFAIGGDIRIPIFSIIFIYLEGIVINKIVTVNKYQTLLIITDNVEGMRDLILKELERSGTIFTGKGLYHNVERNMIYTTVNKKEYNVIKFAAKKLDPNCFITIISNTETLGEGFLEHNA